MGIRDLELRSRIPWRKTEGQQVVRRIIENIAMQSAIISRRKKMDLSHEVDIRVPVEA